MPVPPSPHFSGTKHAKRNRVSKEQQHKSLKKAFMWPRCPSLRQCIQGDAEVLSGASSWSLRTAWPLDKQSSKEDNSLARNDESTSVYVRQFAKEPSDPAVCHIQCLSRTTRRKKNLVLHVTLCFLSDSCGGENLLPTTWNSPKIPQNTACRVIIYAF